MPRAALFVLLSLSACDPARADAEVERVELADGLSDLSDRSGAPRGMTSPQDWAMPLPEPLTAVPVPLGGAYCDIVVEGVSRAMETDYLPHVITCENGGANLEALKAQAIAARSVAYYAMFNDGQICDGQGCQVYTCGAEPQQVHYDAVAATAGQYLSYNGWLTYAFYVAGDNKQPASCIDTDNPTVSGTEQYVTFNEGKTVYDVDQTSLGFVFPENLGTNGYGQNRGCMSQWGARCLENTKGYKVVDIVRFYFGADIEILQAQGGCVVPPNQPAAGSFDAADCAAGIQGWAWDPDQKDAPVDAIVSFLAAHGDANAVEVTLTADQHRDDLCMAIGSCAHGFSSPLPRSLLDGASHPVYVYGVDLGGDGPAQLDGSPRQFACPPPPLPPGVRRHVPDPAALQAWSLSTFWQMAKVDDPTLNAIPEWQAIAGAPALVQVAGDPTLWLVDAGFRRLIASAEVAAAWQFDPATAQAIALADLMAMPQGTDVRPEPFLVQGTGSAVYMLDDPQCAPEGDPADPLCPPEGGTGGDSEGSTGTGGDESGGEVPTTDGIPGSGGDASSSTGGEGPSSAGGGALPPGYGQHGACSLGGSEDRLAPGLLGLLALAGARRRRRRV
ncbi:SpoIID/LytB domain-containing protein [Nannocystis bainbridge]|uniref:SpoIID/LytB domain-containing protein n=1 Tax=Nannocystis bainbridge TaxID=2995303 RepID=A0ABT5E5C5_9BACT|nr:SpoIID/LytB domain-containing protein [Nannocystis bainbridge]MDC0719987.1 SpoIID/LytB domain-containing protein [Nannocystis bainbridge]